MVTTPSAWLVRACGPSQCGDQGWGDEGEDKTKSQKDSFLSAPLSQFIPAHSEKWGLPGSTWSKRDQQWREGRVEVLPYSWVSSAGCPAHLYCQKSLWFKFLSVAQSFLPSQPLFLSRSSTVPSSSVWILFYLLFPTPDRTYTDPKETWPDPDASILSQLFAAICYTSNALDREDTVTLELLEENNFCTEVGGIEHSGSTIPTLKVPTMRRRDLLEM